MSDCGYSCIPVLTGTDREKWNQVRATFFGALTDDPRDPSDPARVAYEAALNAEYSADYTTWITTYSGVAFEQWAWWHWRYGTTAYGNLPDFKANDDVGSCSAPCPYSTQSSEIRTRIMLSIPDANPLPTRVSHDVSGVIHYMRPEHRGKWGYICTYDNCPYYLSTGRRYFYI